MVRASGIPPIEALWLGEHICTVIWPITPPDERQVVERVGRWIESLPEGALAGAHYGKLAMGAETTVRGYLMSVGQEMIIDRDCSSYDEFCGAVADISHDMNEADWLRVVRCRLGLGVIHNHVLGDAVVSTQVVAAVLGDHPGFAVEAGTTGRPATWLDIIRPLAMLWVRSPKMVIQGVRRAARRNPVGSAERTQSGVRVNNGTVRRQCRTTVRTIVLSGPEIERLEQWRARNANGESVSMLLFKAVTDSLCERYGRSGSGVEGIIVVGLRRYSKHLLGRGGNLLGFYRFVVDGDDSRPSRSAEIRSVVASGELLVVHLMKMVVLAVQKLARRPSDVSDGNAPTARLTFSWSDQGRVAERLWQRYREEVASGTEDFRVFVFAPAKVGRASFTLHRVDGMIYVACSFDEVVYRPEDIVIALRSLTVSSRSFLAREGSHHGGPEYD